MALSPPTYTCDGMVCSPTTTWTGETAELPPGWTGVTVRQTDADTGLQALHSGIYCPVCSPTFVAPVVASDLSGQLTTKVASNSVEAAPIQ